MDLKVEQLDSLRADWRTVREKIIKAMDEITDQQIKNSVSLSTAASVRRNISTICYSEKELNGFFILPDELDPDKLTEYFINKKHYIEDRETLYYFVCYSQKRRINSFYRDINKGIMCFGLNTICNKIEFQRLENEIKERLSDNVKIIRRTTK